MLQEKKNLYVDLDGVVYAWDAQAWNILTGLTGKTLTYPSPSWNSLEVEAGPEAWTRLWTEKIYSLFADGMSIKGAFDALHALSQKYRITLITARPYDSRYATLVWLNRYGIPFDGLIFVGRHQKKPKICPTPPDFFIDDKPENILDAQRDWGLSNSQVFLFPAAYNKNFQHPSRVEGWDEILEKLL